MLVIDSLRELTMGTIAIRIFLSLVIGGVIGLERGSKNQPAGFRTYMIVCLGASLVMMTNQYMGIYFEIGDPSRLGAQVISGIGFLGAGTIIVTKRSQVRGLTTAAGLWSSACLGLAIGVGFYEGAIFAGITILLIMTVLQKIEYYFREKTNYIRLYTHLISIEAMNQLIGLLNEREYKILDMQMSKLYENDHKEIVAIFQIKTKRHISHEDIIQILSTVDGLKLIEEI